MDLPGFIESFAAPEVFAGQHFIEAKNILKEQVPQVIPLYSSQSFTVLSEDLDKTTQIVKSISGNIKQFAYGLKYNLNKDSNFEPPNIILDMIECIIQPNDWFFSFDGTSILLVFFKYETDLNLTRLILTK